MKTYTVSFAASLEFTHDHPERTAWKSFNEFDKLFKVWPSRKAMLLTIRMQQGRAHKGGDWVPVVKLRDGE
jgi:hypothetical protein